MGMRRLGVRSGISLYDGYRDLRSLATIMSNSPLTKSDKGEPNKQETMSTHFDLTHVLVPRFFTIAMKVTQSHRIFHPSIKSCLNLFFFDLQTHLSLSATPATPRSGDVAQAAFSFFHDSNHHNVTTTEDDATK